MCTRIPKITKFNTNVMTGHLLPREKEKTRLLPMKRMIVGPYTGMKNKHGFKRTNQKSKTNQ